jgi:hypothetical protein
MLSFSLTDRELMENPWTMLDEQLEQLDVKYSAEYDAALTTHVVTKKRNTSKGLRALVDGRFIVQESFVQAILDAAKTPNTGDATVTSPLESDFRGSWPDPLEHLPPRGEEPVHRPVNTYAPNDTRKEIFDGYTFVFYVRKQYENLCQPITAGKGKALLNEVVPHKTTVDAFVRGVKEVAGEKGLGEFEDGSEGKGVVVVRAGEKRDSDYEWFADFATRVSLQLGSRLITQRDFLDAILTLQPDMLRRPLEEESAEVQDSLRSQPRPISPSSMMDIDEHHAISGQYNVPSTHGEIGSVQSSAEMPPPPRTAASKIRKPIRSRFKGFDVDMDPDESEILDVIPAASVENASIVDSHQVAPATSSVAGGKRRALEDPEDVFEELAPAANAIKRRRVAEVLGTESNYDVFPSEENDAKTPLKGRKAKNSDTIDVLGIAKKRREELEKKRAEEDQERLQQIPDENVDYEEIRKLTLVEDVEIRRPPEARTREQEVSDGRWDPRWNGRRNFKKFRKQGDVAGRPTERVLVGLEPVAMKQYGIGDKYWVDNVSQPKHDSSIRSQSIFSEPQSLARAPASNDKDKASRISTRAIQIDSDSDDYQDSAAAAEVVDSSPEPEPVTDLPRTRAGKKAEKAATQRSQRAPLQTQTQAQRAKRVAATSLSGAKPSKRPRRGQGTQFSDDSDDDAMFKFG